MRKLQVTRAPETGWGCLTPSLFRSKPVMARTTSLAFSKAQPLTWRLLQQRRWTRAVPCVFLFIRFLL